MAAGIFPATGQSCISGSRLLVHRSIIDEFTERHVGEVKKARVGDPDDPDRTGREPPARIAAAEAAGHRLVLDERDTRRDKGYYIEQTIFAGVPNRSDLARNEVFGPAVSTEGWNDEEEAIRIANDTVHGLAAGLWSRDVTPAMRMTDRVEAGTVYINNSFTTATPSPAGGFKQSGYSRENGW